MKNDTDHSRITHLEDQISFVIEEIKTLQYELAHEKLERVLTEKRIFKMLETVVD